MQLGCVFASWTDLGLSGYERDMMMVISRIDAAVCRGKEVEVSQTRKSHCLMIG